MRRMTLAARRARIYLRRPPKPRWWQPAIYGGGLALAVSLVAGLGFWLGSAGVAAHAGSALTDRALALTGRLGFAVREVYADGRVRTDPEALRTQLGIAVGQPILADRSHHHAAAPRAAAMGRAGERGASATRSHPGPPGRAAAARHFGRGPTASP